MDEPSVNTGVGGVSLVDVELGADTEFDDVAVALSEMGLAISVGARAREKRDAMRMVAKGAMSTMSRW